MRAFDAMTNIKPADRRAIFSRLFGNNIQKAASLLAALLARLGVSPIYLTVLGLLCATGSSILLAYGAGSPIWTACQDRVNWSPLGAAACLILASAFDMLDGVVARGTARASKLGAFLDSSLDRLADAAIFLGILIYYLRHREAAGANLFAVATVVALVNAEIISYIKARAENFIEKCDAGYWQRGERIAAILIGLFAGHTATVMVMLAVLGGFTVLRRVVFAAGQVRRADRGEPFVAKAPLRGLMRLALWRYRRGTVPYDIVTAINILIILLVDLQAVV